MIVYGYVLDSKYEESGEFKVKVRIPSIHGPMNQKEYKGQRIHTYVADKNIPYFSSLLLPHVPSSGEVVALASTNDTANNWLVIGYTGASYSSNTLSTE